MDKSILSEPLPYQTADEILTEAMADDSLRDTINNIVFYIKSALNDMDDQNNISRRIAIVTIAIAILKKDGFK